MLILNVAHKNALCNTFKNLFGCLFITEYALSSVHWYIEYIVDPIKLNLPQILSSPEIQKCRIPLVDRREAWWYVDGLRRLVGRVGWAAWAQGVGWRRRALGVGWLTFLDDIGCRTLLRLHSLLGKPSFRWWLRRSPWRLWGRLSAVTLGAV